MHLRSMHGVGTLVRANFRQSKSTNPIKTWAPASNCLRSFSLASRDQASSSKVEGQKLPVGIEVTLNKNWRREQWGDLSVSQKAARTTEQTFNLGIIVVGLGMTVGVAYILYTEVFASDSKTRQFNRVVDRIRADPQAIKMLGSGQTIRAFGEPSMSKWTRNRPIASTIRTDQTGLEHFQMHFNVEGSANSGIVNLHMVKGPGFPDWQYRTLTLDVKGQARYYLENANAPQEKKKPGFKMLGVQWR